MGRGVQFFLGFLTLIFGCNSCVEKERTNDGKLTIVTTTNLIADAVRQVVKDKAHVISLMGAGVDPHLYKASQGDIYKLGSADVIVHNGLHLEGKMHRVFEKLSNTKSVIVMSDGVPKSKLLYVGAETYDPHIWFDVTLWNACIQHFCRQISHIDTANAAFYNTNSEKYSDSLLQTDDWVRKQIAKIPSEQRIIITAHDAFSYYGRAYNIEVKGLQGISTLSDYGLSDITELVKLIVGRRIKSVFIETSVSTKSVRALIEGCKAQGHEVSLGGELYSDALDADTTPQGNYIGMLVHNTAIITKSLR